MWVCGSDLQRVVLLVWVISLAHNEAKGQSLKKRKKRNGGRKARIFVLQE